MVSCIIMDNIDCNKHQRQGQGFMICSSIKISFNSDCNKRHGQGQGRILGSNTKNCL